jgi:hypothetical protein
VVRAASRGIRPIQVALAKVVSEFAKDHPALKLVACVVDAREVYGADGIKQLATLPGLNELRAQLLALINTPATQLVRLVNTPAGQVARAIDARPGKARGRGGVGLAPRWNNAEPARTGSRTEDLDHG